MVTPRSVVSREALSDITTRLLEACADLTKAVQVMQAENMAEALIPWTNAHWNASEKIIEAGVLVYAATKTEAAAAKAGRKSKTEQERERGVSHHPNLRKRDRQRLWLPQVQAELMQIDLHACWRMELHHALILVPKKLLDVLHLFPGWARVSFRDADMIPPKLIAGDDCQASGWPLDHERPTHAIGFFAGQWAFNDPSSIHAVREFLAHR